MKKESSYPQEPKVQQQGEGETSNLFSEDEFQKKYGFPKSLFNFANPVLFTKSVQKLTGLKEDERKTLEELIWVWDENTRTNWQKRQSTILQQPEVDSSDLTAEEVAHDYTKSMMDAYFKVTGKKFTDNPKEAFEHSQMFRLGCECATLKTSALNNQLEAIKRVIESDLDEFMMFQNIREILYPPIP